MAGGRTVPVELGSSYADDDWGQQLMTIEKFVDEYMLQPFASHKPKGYLAQHMLFDQVVNFLELSVLHANQSLHIYLYFTVKSF